MMLLFPETSNKNHQREMLRNKKFGSCRDEMGRFEGLLNILKKGMVGERGLKLQEIDVVEIIEFHSRRENLKKIEK